MNPSESWAERFEQVIQPLADAMTAIMVERQEQIKMLKGFSYKPENYRHPADIAHEEVEKVKAFIESLLTNLEFEERGRILTSVVEWDQKLSGWSPLNEFTTNGVNTCNDEYFPIETCRVIGNIHQNYE